MIAHLLAVARLPPRVSAFYARALLTARRQGDDWSLAVVTRPAELATILRLARGRTNVVEIGTATAWTSCALVLADRKRRVLTLDVVERDHRDRYLALLPADARARLDLRTADGAEPPEDARDVDLLFIDGEHDEASTRRFFEAWKPRLAPDALILFHDFGDPDYPGVERAVRALGLTGRAHRRVFAATV